MIDSLTKVLTSHNLGNNLGLKKGILLTVAIDYFSGTIHTMTGEVRRTAIDDYLRQRYRILEALDMDINRFKHSQPRLMQVLLRPGKHFLVPGNRYKSPYEEAFGSEDPEFFGWTDEVRPASPEKGIVHGVASLADDTGTPILHLFGHVTDIEMSFAARIEDILAVHEYPEEFAQVYVAYQNAEVDGDTYFYNRFKDHPEWPVLTKEELEPFVKNHAPAPKLIYMASE